MRAARLAAAAGADGITAHLREDRRHISDDDIARLTREIDLPLNLEMAATDEMLAIALRHRPHAACLVPEKRNELTTEGGLDAAGGSAHLAPLRRARWARPASASRCSSIPSRASSRRRRRLGAPVVELHTGAYCDAAGAARERELQRLVAAAAACRALGLECHAGHGLGFDTVGPVAAIPTIVELNIGHFLIGEAIFGGLDGAIRRMRALMDEARAPREERLMILGIGSDLIDISRIERTLERFGDRFLDRIFTAAERARSERRADRAASYAKRYAAKEACAKALGTGFRARRLLARHRRRQPRRGAADPGADRRRAGAARERSRPPGMAADIALTLTDEPPLAQAIVIITAEPR